MPSSAASISRTGLVQEVAERTGHPEATVNEIVVAFIDAVARNLAADHTVVLRGFGTFVTRSLAARTRTLAGRTVTTPAGRTATLRPSPALRKILEQP